MPHDLVKGKLSVGTDQVDSDRNSEAAHAKARQFVYEELVSTEQDYIKDLKTIVDVSVCCSSRQK